MAEQGQARHEQSRDIVTRNIAGETLLVPVKHNVTDMQRIYALGEVAAFLWGRIDGEHDIDMLTEAVVTEYAVDIETARRDVEEFLNELVSAGLIEH